MPFAFNGKLAKEIGLEAAIIHEVLLRFQDETFSFESLHEMVDFMSIEQVENGLKSLNEHGYLKISYSLIN